MILVFASAADSAEAFADAAASWACFLDSPAPAADAAAEACAWLDLLSATEADAAEAPAEAAASTAFPSATEADAAEAWAAAWLARVDSRMPFASACIWMAPASMRRATSQVAAKMPRATSVETGLPVCSLTSAKFVMSSTQCSPSLRGGGGVMVKGAILGLMYSSTSSNSNRTS